MLLYSNKCENGWSTVGKHYVRLEKWYFEIHATHILIPSYGGWLHFKGVPLHLWNYNTFTTIRKACGGFLAVARETMELENLIAKVKVCYNYTGFVPTSILITDVEGKEFVVN